MLTLSAEKRRRLENVSTKNGIISALAIDQRGALKKMLSALGQDATLEQLEGFKVEVSRLLTVYASSILLDPEYGLPAAEARDTNSGLLLAYEQTGYDATKPGRLPDLLPEWTAYRLKEKGADAVKFLLYYDVDDDPEVNYMKHVFVERLGSECEGEEMPFFLELVSYDKDNADASSFEYAKVKPHKVNAMMKEFSKPQYKVDVLKVEVPVNMNFVEGYGDEVAYSKEEAAAYFKEQSEATHLPFIFLSAGVSAELFQETLMFANEAGSTFNGVLCGRATWKDAVKPYATEGKEAADAWLETKGRANIESLNEVLEKTAQPWFSKVQD